MCVFEMSVRVVSDQLSVVDSLKDSCICVSDSVVCQACVTVRVRANMFFFKVCVYMYIHLGRWRRQYTFDHLSLSCVTLCVCVRGVYGFCVYD